MTSKAQEVLDLVEQADIFEMAASLKQDDTGLPFIVWVSTKESSGTEISHRPRVKVQIDHSQKARKDLMLSLSLSDDPQFITKSPHERKLLKRLNPKDQQLAKTFVQQNKEVLLDYWNDEIGTKKMLSGLK